MWNALIFAQRGGEIKLSSVLEKQLTGKKRKLRRMPLATWPVIQVPFYTHTFWSLQAKQTEACTFLAQHCLVEVLQSSTISPSPGLQLCFTGTHLGQKESSRPIGYQCLSLCYPCKFENQLLINKNEMKYQSLEGRMKVDLKKKIEVFYILGQSPVKLFSASD